MTTTNSQNDNSKSNKDVNQKENLQRLQLIDDSILRLTPSEQKAMIEKFLILLQDNKKDNNDISDILKKTNPYLFQLSIPYLFFIFDNEDVHNNAATILDLLAYLDQQANFLFISTIDPILVIFVTEVLKLANNQSDSALMFLQVLATATKNGQLSSSKKRLITALIIENDQNKLNLDLNNDSNTNSDSNNSCHHNKQNNFLDNTQAVDENEVKEAYDLLNIDINENTPNMNKDVYVYVSRTGEYIDQHGNVIDIILDENGDYFDKHGNYLRLIDNTNPPTSDDESLTDNSDNKNNGNNDNNSDNLSLIRIIPEETINQIKNVCPGALDGYLLYSIMLLLSFDEFQCELKFFKDHSHETMNLPERAKSTMLIKQAVLPFFNLLSLIKTYKNRRDLPDCIDYQLNTYLTSIEYNSSALNQDKTTLLTHNKNVKFATAFLDQLVENNLLIPYFQHVQYDFHDLYAKKEVQLWQHCGKNFLNGVVWIDRQQLVQSFENSLDDNINYKNFILKLDDPTVLAKPPLDFSNEQIFDHLTQKFPNFSETVQFFKSQFRLNRVTGKNRIQPVLLLGDPGIGKTYFAKTLAKLLNTGYTFIDLASATDAWVLSGLHASWKNGKPGKLFQAMLNSNTANPVVLLDEIEKAPKGHHDSTTPLYQILEETNAKEFVDEFVDFPTDLSHLIIIACANDITPLSDPLQSRFRIFNIPNPTKEQQKTIVQSIYEDEVSNSPAFDKKLDDHIIDQLSNFSIRECKVRIAEAVGNSLLALSDNNLNNIKNKITTNGEQLKIKIESQHINFNKPKKKVFGFNEM